MHQVLHDWWHKNEEGRKHEVICMEFLFKPPLEVQNKRLLKPYLYIKYYYL